MMSGSRYAYTTTSRFARLLKPRVTASNQSRLLGGLRILAGQGEVVLQDRNRLREARVVGA